MKKTSNEKALLSISEVSSIFGIHQDTLRNWEKKGLITPLRVGPRGDRKYRPEDIERIANDKSIMKNFDAPLTDDTGKMNLTQLKQFLWRSADILRGKIDSSDYKKYIFGLLFYKRISDSWDEEYKKVLEEYHDEEVARSDHNHRFQVPKDCRWEVIQNQAEGIGHKLNEIFDKLTNANSPKLDKIFDDLDFANKDKFPNETIQRLINHFSQHNFGDNYISSDLLGDAYEYLIEQFAADAGKKGGEFYTPREVERVIINILKPHEKDHIYDMAVGSGGFLLEAYHHLKNEAGEKKARSLYLYGQEINIGTYAIAKINMFLHGLDSADIQRGDTLADPKFLNPDGSLKTFDICVANPPYSIKEWDYEIFKSDKYKRLAGYDTPPDKNADFAFLLHMVKSMNENGRAGIVLPHAVLFRGGSEGRIRQQLIKSDLIETIIGLPPKLFYGTKISAIILILNKNKPIERKGKVLIVNAESEFVAEKKQNRLRKVDIEKICSAVEAFKTSPRFSEVVDIKQITNNDYFLNIDRYVDTSEKESAVDLDELERETTTIEQEISQLRENIKKLSKAIKTKGVWKNVLLKDILMEHKELSSGKEEVHSVSVKKGVVNQIEHLGRSYSAADTSNYKLVKPGDIVYTKSPTGDFPYGIIKQSKIKTDAIVSPLYGVFAPINKYIGTILDAYFESRVNTNNYLKPIVSKGAKNTINITNTVFLSKGIYLPINVDEQREIAEILEIVSREAYLYGILAEKYSLRKRALVQDLLNGKVR